ncbi:MAG: Predicted L-rhamnose ABC transporter, transmembrane component 1 [uncultured Phycisphaerae bacterium]|uniref:Autoinducer 2 import system permease protein LsrD n=1 Tax=uncultured Phycisphaerae bacterium TaxID=904963 RepID=A0A6J4NV52_9BACT|nr:MAG: Predicted L-rhamnose ABC transporter, transmembrane component 1 [uncultured Phycisphaerae bacterium]
MTAATPHELKADLPPARCGSFPYWHELVLAALLVAILVVAGQLEPRFVRPAVQVGLAGDAWALALLALPMTLIIITAGIDLSVGATTALCAVILGLSVEAGIPVWLGVLLALLTGCAGGALNGTLVAWLRVHPLIVTLATLAAYRGVALALTRGRTIQAFPPAFARVAGDTWLGVPFPMWLFVAAALATALFLARTPYGRFLYAMGHNETAARYSAVPVRQIKLALYTLTGLTAGVSAVLLASRYEQAKADFATALELEVITAVVLGGVSIFGGRGNVLGVVLGIALVHESQKFVTWHWRKSELNALVVGGLLIGAVLVNSLVTSRKR